MKIKRSEIDAAIGVEVMGWVKDTMECDPRGTIVTAKFWFTESNLNKPHYSVRKWKPSTDANHANEALEKYCEANKIEALHYLLTDKKHYIYIQRFVSSNVCLGRGISKSLPLAITIALLSAVRGEQVELEA